MLQESEVTASISNARETAHATNVQLLRIPTSDEFQAIAELQALAFAEKFPCETKADAPKGTLKAYRTYHKEHPQKVQHCRIIKDPTTNEIIAACQLQVDGDVGDLSYPTYFRHKLTPGEAYIEWIACHPDHTGKGLGSKLLTWATDYAKDTAKAHSLTLVVMKANQGAVRLYEKKGFVVCKDPHDKFPLFTSLCIFLCFGFRYWTALYMKMPLQESSTEPFGKKDMTG